MKFYTPYDRSPRMQESFTNTKQKVYVKDIDKKTGERILREDVPVDIYDKIQEYAEETKISNLFKRYNMELSLKDNLKMDEAKIVDMTNLPENLIETMAVIDNAKAIFDRQSTEIKQKFNNDFKQFIAGSENGQVVEMLNQELKSQHVQPKMPSYQDILTTMQKQNEMIASLTASKQTEQTTPTQKEIVNE